MAVAGVVEVFAAVVAGSIGAVAVLVPSADRAAAVWFGDRWAAAWHEDRPAELPCVGRWAEVPPRVRAEVPPCAGRGVVALPWVRRAMLPCVGPRATLQSATPTFIAGHTRTFMAERTPIMATALSPQVLSQALQSVPRQRPRTITLSPTTHRTVIRPTRRHTPRVANTRPLASSSRIALNRGDADSFAAEQQTCRVGPTDDLPCTRK